MTRASSFLSATAVGSVILLLLTISLSSVQAWTMTRKQMLQTFTAVTTTLAPTPSEAALDMDAFANSQLTTPSSQMSSDEALCKFGQPSPEKGNACVRAGLSTKSATPGGVDAFGNVDRGDFVRCQYYYELVNDKYVKKSACK